MVDVSTTILPSPSAGSAASMTSTTSGEFGHAQDRDRRSRRRRRAGPSPSIAAERDRGVDRTAAARRDGHVVTGFDEVARHRQPHRPEPDEADVHVPGRRPSHAACRPVSGLTLPCRRRSPTGEPPRSGEVGRGDGARRGPGRVRRRARPRRPCERSADVRRGRPAAPLVRGSRRPAARPRSRAATRRTSVADLQLMPGTSARASRRRSSASSGSYGWAPVTYMTLAAFVVGDRSTTGSACSRPTSSGRSTSTTPSSARRSSRRRRHRSVSGLPVALLERPREPRQGRRVLPARVRGRRCPLQGLVESIWLFAFLGIVVGVRQGAEPDDAPLVPRRLLPARGASPRRRATNAATNRSRARSASRSMGGVAAAAGSAGAGHAARAARRSRRAS